VVPDGGDMPAYFHSGFDAPTGGLGRAGTSQQDLASLAVDSQLVPGMAGRDGAGPDLGAGMNVSPPLPRALDYADGERGGRQVVAANEHGDERGGRGARRGHAERVPPAPAARGHHCVHARYSSLLETRGEAVRRLAAGDRLRQPRVFFAPLPAIGTSV